MTIKAFINSIKSNRSNTLNNGKNALYIVGNESCDLDSCTSSMLMAYFYHCKISQSEDSHVKSQIVYPLMNIPRNDLQLRRDIVHLLHEVDINSEQLLFLDDLEPNKSDNLFLVDHNKITSTLEHAFRANQVVGIIDHHEDELQYKNIIGKGPRIIQKSGSCSSLVMNYWRKHLPEDIFRSETLVKLALAPLLIDTSNMTSKVEPSDEENYNFLKPQIDFDQKKFFKTLKSCKSDLNGFSASQLIRKDYKRWEQPDGSLAIGVSSIGISLEEIHKQAPNFDSECEKWALDNGLAVYCCLTSFKDTETKQHRREVAIWAKDGAVKNLAIDKFAKISENSLNLKPKAGISSGSSKLHVFDQINDKATRKQIAPLLRVAVHDTKFEGDGK